ncbi:D-alanyl-D-alanine carboxypeptidase family protein [Demequina sp. SYSU T00192]|uniref:D-alanyl-D-alanine carboxypeptidase family protein n=1 Tax=Demequina litoralis TaxID=3051660 RepID=A0ABT8GBK4_9MICO|nr:D-alanyl-D-alanine carboxypeptidase family protein [Demequina sp. SYSU T00192]MDN4476519.1 D-alanyl-D-alanine carboxypeptidase family protein [Demequina sp. SYSU T00192]
MERRGGPGSPRGLLSWIATTAVAGALLIVGTAPAGAATVPPTPEPTAVASPDASATVDDAEAAPAETSPAPVETGAPEPEPEPAPPAESEEPAPPSRPEQPAPERTGGADKPAEPSEPSGPSDATTDPEPAPTAPTTPAAPAEEPATGGGTSGTATQAPPAPEPEPYDPDAPASSGVPAPEPLGPVRFDDVSDALGDPTYSSFAAAIAWMGRRGVAEGVLTEAGRAYMPEATATRGEFAAFLYRLAGSPAKVVPRRSPFADAGRGDTEHAAEIAWLAAQGVVTGRLEGDVRIFRPDDPLTRGAMTRMLYRFAGSPRVKDGDLGTYVDVAPGSEMDAAATWLAGTVGELGQIGEDGLELLPSATVSRGAVAAVLRLAHRSDVRFTPWKAPLRLVDPTVVQVDVEGALNLRRGPSTDAAVATQREDGAALDTTGAVTADGWVEVRVGDRLLWASPDYLAVDGSGAPAGGGSAATGDDATGTTAPALARDFDNGFIPADALCGLPWREDLLLACGAADDLARLDAAFHDLFGLHIPVSSAYRDYAGQLAATARYGGMAAVPGTSNHGWGEATDLSEPGLPGGYDGEAYAWLISAAPSYGWTLPAWARPDGSKPEPWHLEHVG